MKAIVMLIVMLIGMACATPSELGSVTIEIQTCTTNEEGWGLLFSSFVALLAMIGAVFFKEKSSRIIQNLNPMEDNAKRFEAVYIYRLVHYVLLILSIAAGAVAATFLIMMI